jgi:hypothetical protein
MKTREMFMIFALTAALSLAVASAPRAGVPETQGLSGASAHAVTLTMPVLGLLQDQPPPVQPAPEKKEVDVTVKTESQTWVVSPVWIAIGILAAVVLLLLIGMAVRGAGSREGTTVVHE